MNSKGQSAVEYLIITSFLLVITGIIFAYSLFIYTDSVSSSTANNAVNSIVNTVDQVYALGPGSSLFVNVDIPQNISDLQLLQLPEGEAGCYMPSDNPAPNQVACQKTALIFKLSTSAGISDIAKSAKGLFEFFGDTQGNPGKTSLALKRQGRYSLKVSWDSFGGTQQTVINVCLHNEDGTCQS